MFKMNKKTAALAALALLILLAISAGMELMIAHANRPEYVLEEGTVNLCPDRLADIFGYEVEGKLFTPTDADPKIYLNTAGLGPLRTVTLALDRPARDIMSAQLYYTGEDGNLSEENSVIVYPSDGAWFARYVVPEREYPLMRLDVNGPVSIDAIYCGPSLTGVWTRYPISKKRLVLIFAALTLLAWLGWALYVGFDWRGRRVEPLEPVKRRLRTARKRAIGLPTLSERARKKQACQLARTFFVIGMIGGVLLTFLTPPMCAPDEDIHFVNVYAISRGEIFPDVYEGALARWIPKYYSDYLDVYPWSLYGIVTDARYSYFDMVRDGYMVGPAPDETPTPNRTGLVSLGYTASALSMAVGTRLGHLLQVPEIDYPYNQMIMGRIGNLLFYLIVCYFAIRRAPHFNRTMALVGLMPMSLFQGASLSYDAMAIPVSMYFIAMALDLSRDGESRISAGDVVRVLLCVFILSGMKFGAYMPLFLILLTIPRAKYGSAWRMVGCIAAVGAAAILGYLPSYIVSSREAALTAAQGIVSDGIQQTNWLMSGLSLWELPRMCFQTFHKHAALFVRSFWGELGWLDGYFPIPVIVTGYGVLFLVTAYEACSCPIWRGSRWKNLLPFIGAMISAAGIFLAMYLSYTSLGAPHIDGVQGRYIIPLFLPMALLLANQLLLRAPRLNLRRVDGWVQMLAKGWCVCCAAVTVCQVLARYWI